MYECVLYIYQWMSNSFEAFSVKILITELNDEDFSWMMLRLHFPAECRFSRDVDSKVMQSLGNPSSNRTSTDV